MRVAVDGTALYSARTGVGVFTAELLEGLGRRTDDDLEPVAYAVTWRGRSRFAELVPNGVRAVGRGPIAARPLRTFWRRFNWPPINWWIGDADVVHGPNFVVPPVRRAAAVVTVHDLTPLRFPILATRDTLAYPALLHRAIDHGAHVHVVSTFIGEEVVDAFDVEESRVHVVPNGVSSVAGGDPAHGRALARHDRYVLAIGTIEPRKNFPSLVRAFDAIATPDLGPDLGLVIAGADGWAVVEFERALDAAHHHDRIVRLGYVTDAQRADLLAGASAFAYPSLYEGFGLPPLEAMQCGVPVVATATGALPEVIGDAGVLVPPNDDDALAAALHRVLTDDQCRADLVERGLSRAATFTWNRCVDGLVDVYRTTAGG